MLNIAGHEGNANQNHSEMPLLPVRLVIIKNQKVGNAGMEMEKGNPHTGAGNVN